MPVREGTLVVLGGSGFLGAHVVQAALDEGRFASVVRAARRPERAPRLRESLAQAEEHAVDLADPEAADGLLERYRPRAVLSCAALSRMADCERDPALGEVLNAALPERVGHWCRRHAARFVHVSTDLVFGANPPRASRFAEDDPVGPLSVYGRTKAEGEARLLAAFPEALVARLPLLFGDSGGRGLGASDSLLAALERGERPGLFHDELRTPLHVANAARALVELVTGDRAGLLHVAGPERLSRLELGREVLRASGLSPQRIASSLRSTSHRAHRGPGGASRPADVSLDASLARTFLETPLLAPGVALASAP